MYFNMLEKMDSKFWILYWCKGVNNDQRKKAILLCSAGPQVQEIFTTLTVASESFTDILNSLNLYFNPKKNVHYEHYKFLQLKQ